MRAIVRFLLVTLVGSSLAGCAVVNGVRYKLAPPTGPANSTSASGKPLERANTERLIAKAKEIAFGTFPLKLEPKVAVRDKILIIEKTETPTVSIKGFNYNGDDYFEAELGVFGFKKEDLAIKPEEVQTVILKACDKGKQIGRYTAGDGSKIPAYALDCKVSIIDFPSSTVVAEKKFSGKQVFDEVETSKTAKEWIAPEPKVEMFEYIKTFPRE